MAFLIGGANSAADTGYDIENSLRFDDLTAHLTFTPGSAGNRRKFTVSMWLKISSAGKDTAGHHIYFAGGGSNFGSIYLNGDRIFFYGESPGYNLNPSPLLRDPAAWYHIVCNADTEQGTAADRANVYINGVKQTAFETETYPAEDADLMYNNNGAHAIGAYEPAGGVSSGLNFWDGYIAEMCMIDGSQLAASAFGETDEDSGIWKPKDFKDDVTFGTNGFYLEFKQTGTSADASGKGADTSGEDNHWDDNNMSAFDQCTDTPTNNFATLNPLWAGAEVTLSEGNCKYAGGTTAGQGPAQACGGTFGVSNGKWYFEVTRKSNDAMVGIMSADTRIGTDNPFGSVFNGKGHGVFTDDGNARSGNANTAYGDSLADDEILGVALDMDNGAIYYSEQGTFYDSGDPTSGASKTGAASNFTAVDTYVLGYIADGASGASSVYEFNFGNPPHSISSGNADANGYGNFEFAVPSGYFAPCTKNLAEYG